MYRMEPREGYLVVQFDRLGEEIGGLALPKGSAEQRLNTATVVAAHENSQFHEGDIIFLQLHCGTPVPEAICGNKDTLILPETQVHATLHPLVDPLETK